MSDRITFDANSNIIRVVLLDSTSTTGGRKTGLTFSSSGLIISTIADVEATATTYTQAASNIEDITTLGTYAAPSANKCRFKQVDATNHPGLYEIQLADARFSVANSKKLTISVHGATGMVQFDGTIDLPVVNLDTATVPVPAGMALESTSTAIKAKTDNLPSGFKKGVGRTIEFPMFLTGTDTLATGKTVTVTFSKDGAAYVASTNSVSEIGSSGTYQLVVTNAEANYNFVAGLAVAAGCDTTPFTMYFTA